MSNDERLDQILNKNPLPELQETLEEMVNSDEFSSEDILEINGVLETVKAVPDVKPSANFVERTMAKVKQNAESSKISRIKNKSPKTFIGWLRANIFRPSFGTAIAIHAVVLIALTFVAIKVSNVLDKDDNPVKIELVDKQGAANFERLNPQKIEEKQYTGNTFNLVGFVEDGKNWVIPDKQNRFIGLLADKSINDENRYILNGMNFVDIKNGVVTISEDLVNQVFEGEATVAVLKLHDRTEIWSMSKYNDFKTQLANSEYYFTISDKIQICTLKVY